MANWTNLKAAIAETITTNGNQEITGAVLQNTLNAIINAIGENATFTGVAIPTTNPGVPDGPVFYLAGISGVYSNFGVTLQDEIAVIMSNGSDSWNKQTVISAATTEKAGIMSAADKKAFTNPLSLATTIGIEEFIAFLPDNLPHTIGVQQITFSNGRFKMYDATLSRAIGFTDGGLAVANPTGIREYWKIVVHEGQSYVYYARINWDIVKEVPWSATPAETFTVSPYPTAHSVAGSNLLNMLQRLDYDIAEVTRYNGDGIAEVQSVTWRDGTTGTATYSDYRADVLEYTTLTVTYNSYVKVVQTREYNDMGDLTKKTTTIKNA